MICLFVCLQAPVAVVMSLVWQVFEPLLFGLVGAEVRVEYMNTKVVGELNCGHGILFLMAFTHRVPI